MPKPQPLNKSLESLTVAQELLALGETKKITRIGLWLIFLGIGGLGLWAALAEIDEGVPTQGIVSIDTKRKTVQHLQGGTVREVLVREGQLVQEGQILLTLDQMNVKANVESIRQLYYAMRAAESRLMAENQDKDKLTLHQDLQEAAKDPLARQHIQTQENLLRARRGALQASLSALEQNLAGLQAQQVGNTAMTVQKQRQLSLFNEEITNIRELVKVGYAHRSREMEFERNIAEVSSTVADLQANGQRLLRAMDEGRQRWLLTKQDYLKEVDTQLAEVRREVQADAEKLKAVTQELQRTELRAPASGQVLGLAVQTIGAVIAPGQKLMEIVPVNAQLIIEARIPSHLIDRVKPGLLIDTRFSAFAHAPQLVVESRVISVANDLLADQETRQSYYLTQAELTPTGLKSLKPYTLQAGMSAELVIKTGQRSVISYLAYPLVRRLANSMKEE